MPSSRRPAELLFAALIVGLLLLAAGPAAMPQSTPESFRIDPDHSAVVFKVRHLGVGTVFGRFNSVRGGFTWDTGDPARGSMRILIDAESVDSNLPARDRRFQSEDLLDASEHSTISFTGKSIRQLHGRMYRITGDLAIRGVRKPVTAEVQWLGSRDTAALGYRGGLEAELTFLRSEFGMLVADEFGDEVTVLIGIEGMRK